MASFLKQYLNVWTVLGALLVSILICVTFAAAVTGSQTSSETHTISTAVMTIIPPPTLTPVAYTQVVTTPEANGGADGEGGISLQDFVEVYDTGAAGLRIRSGPGISHAIKFIALDAELYQVNDGPVKADGYIWWYLVAPYDDQRNGWAVSEYLKLTSP